MGEPVIADLEAGFDHVIAVSETTHRQLLDLIVDRRVGEARGELRADIKDLEVRLRQEIGNLEIRLRQEIGGLEVRLREDLAALRGEVRAKGAETESRLLRWMFLFWVGTIGMFFVRP